MSKKLLIGITVLFVAVSAIPFVALAQYPSPPPPPPYCSKPASQYQAEAEELYQEGATESNVLKQIALNTRAAAAAGLAVACRPPTVIIVPPPPPPPPPSY